MPKLTDRFNPTICEELTGYTFRDIIAMYEDYERMASKNTCAKPFVPRDECFEWRGPQDEKGEAE